MIKILQKFHLRDCALFFSLISALGTFLTHYAVSSTNYQMLVFARFLFGIGLESLYVVSGVGVEKWFPASEVTIINGVARVCIMVLNTLMVYLMPLLYIRSGSFQLVMICLEVVSVFLLLCASVFYTIENKYQEQDSLSTLEEKRQEEKNDALEGIEELSGVRDGVELQQASLDKQEPFIELEDKIQTKNKNLEKPKGPEL